jgi:hypothetical protein
MHPKIQFQVEPRITEDEKDYSNTVKIAEQYDAQLHNMGEYTGPTTYPRRQTNAVLAKSKLTKVTPFVQIPSEEKQRRQRENLCYKCGGVKHRVRECRTGWKYDRGNL